MTSAEWRARVRELEAMPPDERALLQADCARRGHEPGPEFRATNPPTYICAHCGGDVPALTDGPFWRLLTDADIADPVIAEASKKLNEQLRDYIDGEIYRRLVDSDSE